MTNQIPPAAEKFIPIRFMDRDGNVSDTPGGAPVVRAALVYKEGENSQVGQPLRTKAEPKVVYALIDTGADSIQATKEVIAHAQCPKIGTSTMQAATSTVESAKHQGHVWFPDVGMLLSTDVFALPSQMNGQRYPLVIGMAILEAGRLVLDFPNNVFELHLN